MTIRLVDAGWGWELTEALRADATELRIICPFIKCGTIDRLLARRPKSTRVITRFNLNDFAAGVSDISALRSLLDAGAHVKGVRYLHAKIYLFGSRRAIVTSANLTAAALDRNHEFGVVAEDAAVVTACRSYFDALWLRGGSNLTRKQVDAWDKTVTRHQIRGGHIMQRTDLGDFGTDAGLPKPPPMSLPATVARAPQAFVKFLGEGHNRYPLSFPVIDEIERSGCHWALTYPTALRPRAVEDGALMFISRLTSDPNDIRVFGRAIGMRHVPGRDDATSKDIALRGWKAKWSRYVRVHDAEFVTGTLANGVSLYEMMDAVKSDSFVSTQRHAAEGQGNTDPRRAYMQKPAVELTDQGFAWLSERLEAAFALHGKIPGEELAKLDWPPAPVGRTAGP